uniref:Uncharacterized protein n=1 Tax=Coccidioides posadasii RMSCC 3488 TaxID=454284 RepID=A0A0J6F4K7_COCPO|nr:hypothetical protein CPAG_00257 [Coccidioides posadasii RMSCC 3488]
MQCTLDPNNNSLQISNNNNPLGGHISYAWGDKERLLLLYPLTVSRAASRDENCEAEFAMSGGALGEARQKSRDHGFKKSSKIRKPNKFLKISREKPKRRKFAPTVQEAGNWGNDTFSCKARGTSGCFDMGHVGNLAVTRI